MTKIVTMVKERLIEVEIDPKELAKDLVMSVRVAKFRGMRPGETGSLTGTSTDPISLEKLTTLHHIYRALQKRKAINP